MSDILRDFDRKNEFSETKMELSANEKLLKDKIEKLEEENKKLRECIAKLESEKIEFDFPTTPIEVANYLISHTTHCEKYMIMSERDVNTFSVDELMEISEHLQVYCRYRNDKDKWKMICGDFKGNE